MIFYNNWIIDNHKLIIMDIHDWILDIHNCIHNWIVDIHDCPESCVSMS